MARSERICKLINEFMNYHNDGYSIPEIAEIFHVDFSTVYNNLQEIADNNGVTRESLLQVVHLTHDVSNRRLSNSLKEDPYELNKSFEELLGNIDNITTKIDSILLQEDL